MQSTSNVFPITRKAKLLHPVQHWVQGRETYQVLFGILNTCVVHKMGNLIPAFPKHWKDEKQDKVRLSYTAISGESPSTIVSAIFVQIEQGSCPNCKQYLCQIMAQRTKWGQIGLSPHRVGQALRQDRWGRWLCGPGPVTTTCCD